jgi:hypothetical protein
MTLPITGMSTMKGLIQARRGVHTRRESSYDRTGGNADFRPMAPGAKLTLAELAGPGCITHLWMTGGSQDALYLRALVLRIWWDGESTPSVEVPLGDFFGLGHGRIQAYQSYPFTVSGGDGQVGGGTAMNCYFQMPFAASARIEVENQSATSMDCFYYYVDYETYDQPLPEDTLRFHAQWRRENPTKSIRDKEVHERGYWSFMGEPNLDGRENYVILEAQGRGHFVGCNLSVDNFDPLPSGEATWWGEGDDMFHIDGETMPSMTGTGSEDYFCHAWGMQKFAGLYSGVSIWHEVPHSGGAGKFTCYRFHVEDPVRFEKSLRMSIEHGHANLQGNDYASTAYWYQDEPHAPFPALPSRQDRMPREDFVPPTDLHPKEGPGLKPFIRDWLILGPFDNPLRADPIVGSTVETGVTRVYPPEQKLKTIDSPAELRAIYPGKRGPIQWQAVKPEHTVGGHLNLKAALDADWAVAFAKTRVYSKKARKAALWMGSDDGCKVWVNGKCVHEYQGRRGVTVDQDRVVLNLKAGWNTLLVKVEQYTGGWGLTARLEDLPVSKPKPKAPPKTKAKPQRPRRAEDLEARA